MNGAIYDSTVNIFFKMRYAKLYDAMLATSLGPMDVALGEIAWSLLRGGIYSAAFVLVMLVMGLLESWWALLAVPVALLIALGFAAVGMAHDVVHEDLPAAGMDQHGDPADVPVLHHLLPAGRLPAGDPGGRPVPAAVPGHRADARARAWASCLGRCSGTCCISW